jgi:capsular exopolysaccharide synthesis family protein
MKGSPNREKELMAMMRDQSVKQQLYLYLKTKGEENALTRSNADSNASVIDRAHGSNEPISPHTTLIYMLAIIVGLLIPFAILYICELLNTKVRSHKEVESAISAPFAGIIPRHEGKRHGHDIVVREDGRDNISEAFRILRTNLTFMSVDNPIKVIMLTSSVPHSGKTFVASNLAMTLATIGKRVLLVDLDLRRRTLTKLMGHRNDRRGVTSYLTGGVKELKDNITTSEQEATLDMMFSGPQPPNPTELLMSKRMEELINELRERYDYIIIDSVPALAVADAVVVDRLVDHTIYVVRQGNLDRRQLPDIEALYTEKKLHNMSILFNGATITKRSYGYSYYGYDDDSSQWKRRWRTIKKLFKK